MKHLLRKISKDKAELLGRISIGDVDISVAESNGVVSGLINGFKVVDAGLYEDFIERIIPVLSMVIAKIYRDKVSEGGKLIINESEWDTEGKYPSRNLLARLLTDLKRHIDSEAIEVIKEDKQPEDSNAEPQDPPVKVDLEALATNLHNFSGQVAAVFRLSERALDRSLVLTRRKLISDMWGAEKTQAVIDNIRQNLKSLEGSITTMGFNVNTVVKGVNRIVARINKGITSEDDQKYVSTILIPDVTGAFYAISDSVIKVTVAITPLITIDDIFQKHTNNPASWFLPTNVLEDLKEAHEVLIDYLSDIPSIELSIIEPLSVLKMQASQNKDRDEVTRV